MAYSEAFSGTATIGSTEFSLTNGSTSLTAQTTDAQVDVLINCSNMAAGDQYEVAVYEKVISTDSQILAFPVVTLTGPQPSAFVLLTPTVMHGWEVTMKKIAGTDRSFKYSVRTIT